MNIRIRYNARTYHLEGIPEATGGDGTERGGVIGYYATSACPALTRSAHRMATGQTYSDVAAALGMARIESQVNDRSLCRHCERAAERGIADRAPETGTVFDQIESGTDVQLYLTDGSTIAGVFDSTGSKGVTITTLAGRTTTFGHSSIGESEAFIDGEWIDLDEADAAAALAAESAADHDPETCIRDRSGDNCAECERAAARAEQTPERPFTVEVEHIITYQVTVTAAKAESAAASAVALVEHGRTDKAERCERIDSRARASASTPAAQV